MTEEKFDKLLYRPSEAFTLTGVSRSHGYALIASGEWPSLRIGRALRIPASALQQWIDRKLTESELEAQASDYRNRR